MISPKSVRRHVNTLKHRASSSILSIYANPATASSTNKFGKRKIFSISSKNIWSRNQVTYLFCKCVDEKKPVEYDDKQEVEIS